MFSLDDRHKRKALIEATIVMLLLIFLMFIGGMTYLDPPPETGIAVNFGTSSLGSGKIQPQRNEPPKPVKTQTEKIEENVVQPKIKEEVLTQNTEEAPVIKKKKKKKKQQPKPKPSKPKPSSEASNALSNVINASGTNTNNSTGEGNDMQARGDKGNPNGDPNASGYYGNGGKGGGGHGNYQLGNRNALSKPQPDYQCNEEGTVIVRIYVNRSGSVIKAVPGYKGSTNLAPCLLKAAKKAALHTKWQPDAKAPEKQIGKIIYRFKLTE